MAEDAIALQRKYYEQTARNYESMHVSEVDEHARALATFVGLAGLSGPPESVLDVGAGTGRALQILRPIWPDTRVVGVEPVAALREVGHAGGIPEGDLVEGDALDLHFEADSFDFVIETGVLHHIPDPRIAVREMVRVARRGVMISDSNNLGQGSVGIRYAKLALKGLGLWPTVNFLQTGGRGYKESSGDGIYYSFCAFDMLPELRQKFPELFLLSSQPTLSANLKVGAGHVMILALSGPTGDRAEQPRGEVAR